MSAHGTPAKMKRFRNGSPAPVGRRRSDGPLCAQTRADHLRQGVPLAFDPLQSGWVPHGTEDDLAWPPAGTGPRVILRPWQAGDHTVYRDLLDDAELWRTLPEPYPDPLTEDLAAGLIELSNTAPHHRVRAVLHEGRPVGQVRLEFGVSADDPAQAELSYWIGRPYWRRGLARAAVAQLLAETPPQPLRARVLPCNTASRRVLEGAGFVPEGPDPRVPGWSLYHRRWPAPLSSGSAPA